LSKDYGNLNNHRIFRTTVVEKNRNPVNFKVIKNKSQDSSCQNDPNNLVKKFSISSEISNIESEEAEHLISEEKKKELEKLLDNFMSSKKRRRSFCKENYLDFLICKIID
jgi:hypothetical protein